MILVKIRKKWNKSESQGTDVHQIKIIYIIHSNVVPYLNMETQRDRDGKPEVRHGERLEERNKNGEGRLTTLRLHPPHTQT